MANKPTRISRVWENVCLTEYPGEDGTQHSAEPGDVIDDAAPGWPPDWVVDAGYVRPATSEGESN